LRRILPPSTRSAFLIPRLAERSLTMRIASFMMLAALGMGPFVLSQTPASLPLQTTSGTGFTAAPYSATETTAHASITPAGEVYGSSTVVLLWRDSAGRTREEHIGQDASGAETRSVIVKDPVAGVFLKWTVSKASPNPVATIWPMPPNQQTTAPVPPQTDSTAPAVVTTPCGDGCQVKSEIIEPKLVNGIACIGRQITRTFKAGVTDTGQVQMATVRNETWIAPDLRIIVRHVSDDSTSGIMESNLTSIVRGEPAASLFVVPPGYQVRDMRQQPSPGR
jgi:hypothetical protein